MRVLITGAGGSLGRRLAPMLHAAGHEPVLSDVTELDTEFEFVRADVRKPAEIARAVTGADAIVHAAAIHGIHLRDHSPRQFFELNLAGTFNVCEAAVAASVEAVVFCSTMGVYGESRQPRSDDEVVAVNETLTLRPTDIYGYTKLAGEELCRYYVRRHRRRAVALRLGMFVPEPFFRYGIRLLYGGVDVTDAALAAQAALEALVDERVEWDAFNVHSVVPFSDADGPQLRHDPLAVLERHLPGSAELLRARGVEQLQPIDSYFPMERIANRLGFRPRHNFDGWLDDLRSRPDERAAQPVPWP